VIHYYPQNQLTDYLIDLREYRPKCIQKFFKELARNINAKPLIKRLITEDNQDGMIELLRVYEEIYLFRNGHWQFVQKYIMANTKYAKATGGTPIISWLPNQMKAVMNEMKNVIKLIGNNKLHDASAELYIEVKNNIDRKVDLLNHQLELINKKTFSAKKVFDLNEKYNLSDKSN